MNLRASAASARSSNPEIHSDWSLRVVALLRSQDTPHRRMKNEGEMRWSAATEPKSRLLLGSARREVRNAVASRSAAACLL